MGVSIKYKAIFVARGFSQHEGEDYDETFAPVFRYTSIRAIIYIAHPWVGVYIRWMQRPLLSIE
jgi:hypothetical protein